MTFETFDHTADVGLRIETDDLPTLFSEAARGMFSLIVANYESVQPTETVDIALPAEELDSLLRNWLAELLYLFHVREWLLARVEVEIDRQDGQAIGCASVGTVAKASLKAKLHGEPVDRSRHMLDAEIKAVTWHGLRLEPVGQGWIAEVIVDI